MKTIYIIIRHYSTAKCSSLRVSVMEICNVTVCMARLRTQMSSTGVILQPFTVHEHAMFSQNFMVHVCVILG